MPDDSDLGSRLLAALSSARGRDASSARLDHLLATAGTSVHTLRATLDALQRDPNTVRALPWPSLQAVRARLLTLDGVIDRGLLGVAQSHTLTALAEDLARCGSDAARARRSIMLAAERLGPPMSRANAALIDLLRSASLGAAREVVYAALVDRGADIRGPLADEHDLAPSVRLAVLEAFAERRRPAGVPSFAVRPDATLARALADWTSWVTHPRHLFFAWRAARGFESHEDYTAALDPLVRWPLAPDVRIQWYRERAGVPIALRARALGGGRFACARCGAASVCAIPQGEPEAEEVDGHEIAFECAACGLGYHQSWDAATLAPGTKVVPIGWAPA